MESVRKILARSGRHSPSEIRDKISRSLTSRLLQDRLDALKSVDYTLSVDMSIESKKAVAFQFAQSIALMEGIVYFSFYNFTEINLQKNQFLRLYKKYKLFIILDLYILFIYFSLF